VGDMCYEIRRAEACVDWSDHHTGLLLFITAVLNTKLCAWGRRIVEDMCYEILRAEACVD